jgi:hypothetical protein
METSEVLLKELTFEDGTLVHKWPFVQIEDKAKFYRVYYKERVHSDGATEGMGFDFCVVYWIGSGIQGEHWSEESDCQVDVHMWGNALFDGIRHIFNGDSANSGYIYYPDTGGIIKVFECLRDLETKYCNSPDHTKG